MGERRFASFKSFMEEAVLPLHREHPDWVQLDGTTDANPGTYAWFDHERVSWRVALDTRFAPLEVAYAAISEAPPLRPFRVADPTAGHRRRRLLLHRGIRGRLSSDHEHLYVYDGD